MRIALVLTLLLVSCAPPEGRFACTTDEACPLGWSCVAGYCYSSANRPDAADPADAPSDDAADAASDDAGPICGDGTCAGEENVARCPADCSPVCGDGRCEGTEDRTTCPADCG